MRPQRRTIAIIAISLSFSLYAFWLLSEKSNYDFLLLSPEGESFTDSSSSEDLSCRFVRLDPFDPSIRKYISHPRSVECERVQPYDMTWLDDQGRIRMNLTEWQNATAKYCGNVVCLFRKLDRPPDPVKDDNAVVYGEWQILWPDLPQPLPGDAVDVQCRNGTDGEPFYYNIHAHPTLEGKREFQDVRKAPEDQLSVLMVIIDSVSLSALKRNLPATYKYLTDEMGFFVFNGYNKVGENSRPNMFPVLMGKRIRDEQVSQFFLMCCRS